jgi:hypothetical protein
MISFALVMDVKVDLEVVDSPLLTTNSLCYLQAKKEVFSSLVDT